MGVYAVPRIRYLDSLPNEAEITPESESRDSKSPIPQISQANMDTVIDYRVNIFRIKSP